MKLVGHKTESIYRRYAIANSVALREAGAKLAALQASEAAAAPVVVALKAGTNEYT
jgi:hypothetical protein